MMIILYVCVALWLTLAIVDVSIGLFQIVTGFVLTLLAATLYVLVGFAELVAKLWRTAFSGQL